MAVLARGSTGSGFFQVQGEPFCHLLEPRTNVADLFAGLALDGEGEEDGLGRIFRIMPISKDLEADVEDHGRVSAHNLLEWLLAAAAAEFRQQLLGAFGRTDQDMASRNSEDDTVAEPLHKTTKYLCVGDGGGIVAGFFLLKCRHG